MFKRSLNRAVVRLRVRTVSPLLIRAGDTGLDPARADLSCVRTHHGRFGETVYIPGSSFKGVLRSTAESLVRGDEVRYGPSRDVEGACDPLDHGASCGGRAPDPRRTSTAAVYAAHCLACRCFGSTALKGRVAVRDLFPWPGDVTELGEAEEQNRARANAVEARNGVAIDRISGSVKYGPFDMEMIPAGVDFYGDIALENYQAWQIGLLSAALADLNDGFGQLGSTKSRGLGVVRISVTEVIHEQPLRHAERPVGVGRLVDDATRQAYKLLPDGDLPAANGQPRGLSRRFTARDAQAQRWIDAAQQALEAL